MNGVDRGAEELPRAEHGRSSIPEESARVRAAPATPRPWLLILLALVLNALDGYDILAISFAAPGIAREWHVPPAALGIVLSMELVGMALGSILLGRVADRFGRRPAVLGCLMVMAIGMTGATASTGLLMLCISRVSTGLGIGGMLASLNAMVSEAAAQGRKALAVAVMSSGYSIGGLIGGAITAELLTVHGWRSAFFVGASGTALLIPIIWRLFPESAAYLALEPRASGAISARAEHPVQARFGDLAVSAITYPRVLAITSVLTAAYLLHAVSFYFVLKWMPKLAVNLGHSASSASHLLVLANAGGVIGALGFGVLGLKVPVRSIAMVSLPAMSALLLVFGADPNPVMLSLVATLIGCTGNASVSGLYALCAESFPTSVRAGGTGLVIGLGRGGAVLGPIAAGLLIGAHFAFSHVVAIMALGSVCGALALVLLPRTMRLPARGNGGIEG